jgi:hypothetical protein
LKLLPPNRNRKLANVILAELASQLKKKYISLYTKKVDGHFKVLMWEDYSFPRLLYEESKIKLDYFVVCLQKTEEQITDAVHLLISNGHAIIIREENGTEISMTLEGHVALRDGFYLKQYHSIIGDFNYNHSRWLLPLATLVLAIIALMRTCNSTET